MSEASMAPSSRSTLHMGAQRYGKSYRFLHRPIEEVMIAGREHDDAQLFGQSRTLPVKRVARPRRARRWYGEDLIVFCKGEPDVAVVARLPEVERDQLMNTLMSPNRSRAIVVLANPPPAGVARTGRAVGAVTMIVTPRNITDVSFRRIVLLRSSSRLRFENFRPDPSTGESADWACRDSWRRLCL